MTIVKKMCVTPSTFHNGQVGRQIRHLLNQTQILLVTPSLCHLVTCLPVSLPALIL
jgi:hypothetical protein